MGTRVMKRMLRGGVVIALLAFGLAGCGSLKSEFNYAGDATETATLLVSKQLKVRSLDGQSASLPRSLNYPYTVTLSAGPHTVSFQYIERWGEGRSREKVRSAMMELNFEAQAGESYRLKYQPAESIADSALADAYLESFSAWLADEQGRKVAARSSESLERRGMGLSDKGSSADSSVTVTEPGSRLRALKKLWRLASDEEKVHFDQWVQEQQ